MASRDVEVAAPAAAGVAGREAVMNVDGRRNERSIFAWEERGRRAFPPHTLTHSIRRCQTSGRLAFW